MGSGINGSPVELMSRNSWGWFHARYSTQRLRVFPSTQSPIASAGFLTRVSCDGVARKSRIGKSVLPLADNFTSSQL